MDPAFAVFADFGSRPAELTNAVVRHHRCAVASSYVVVTAGGHLKADFVVPDHLDTAEAVRGWRRSAPPRRWTSY